ncbi:hypothetical protein [Aegicerativicinus sediminis]|uniref:hypothetical protein n=1 Tax=Aegicerativicinus sediminis TaxID=2893202 RepID=UPI001E37FB4E|nr:hypothetical protein [Aegicerativicinus sediminis]
MSEAKSSIEKRIDQLEAMADKIKITVAGLRTELAASGAAAGSGHGFDEKQEKVYRILERRKRHRLKN